VRTYATKPDYEPRLVRKPTNPRTQNPRPQRYNHTNPQPVIKVGSHFTAATRISHSSVTVIRIGLGGELGALPTVALQDKVEHLPTHPGRSPVTTKSSLACHRNRRAAGKLGTRYMSHDMKPCHPSWLERLQTASGGNRDAHENAGHSVGSLPEAGAQVRVLPGASSHHQYEQAPDQSRRRSETYFKHQSSSRMILLGRQSVWSGDRQFGQ
jgi:hypothetical protein